MSRKLAAMMKTVIFFLLAVVTVGYFGAVSAEKANCTKDESYASFEAAMNEMLWKHGRPCKEDTEPAENYGSQIKCAKISVGPPTNIHTLSPQHVDVVAAMGDSITAGYGIASECLIRNFIAVDQGLSWSIGGDKDLSTVTTLPNMIKEFNRGVIGFSKGTAFPKTFNKKRGFNRAVGAAQSFNMLCQAEDLVDEMQKKGVTDSDWKVITIWIGSNDLCDPKICDQDIAETVSNYINEIKKALDYLQANTTRAFVNLVKLVDVSFMRSDMHIWPLVCLTSHTVFCHCATNKDPDRAKLVANTINDRLEDLVNSGVYDSDLFTVVLQPFFSETDLPLYEGDPDTSIFAPDCFHFSQKGHTIAATHLWNNMLEPVGSKVTQIDWGSTPALKCPTQVNPYFYTRENSEI